MKVDLHTHTNASDGALTPEALVGLARESGVTLLSVTDHDTAAGCLRAQKAAKEAGIAFIPGVELSVRWGGTVLHVVGLGMTRKTPSSSSAFARPRAFAPSAA